MDDKKVLHLMTQDNQPYGSTRRCCERCGRMIWGSNWNKDTPNHRFTDSRDVYAEAEKHGFERCS